VAEVSVNAPPRFQPQGDKHTTKGVPSELQLPLSAIVTATAFTTPSANAFLSTAFPVFTESQSERFLCAFNALSKMVQV